MEDQFKLLAIITLPFLVLVLFPDFFPTTEEPAQDEIARIRKRKRGRNILNCSGNTTDNLCFCYRFRDVFSRFRCCVYNGTGPLSCKHNGNMELHVSATFPFTDSCNLVLCCVYNGTGPLLHKHNGNMELHVSATFLFTDSCNLVLCWA